MSASLLEQLVRCLGPEGLAAALSPEERLRLKYEWRAWARPAQLEPPGDWNTWLVMSGRGAGKTRTGAEWVREQVERHGCRRIALVARTAADARDVVIEGESGILAVCPPWNRPQYEPSKRRLTWPNGALASVYSADEPDLLRGPQHDAAYTDEVASWQRPEEVWSNLQFGLRLGQRPRVVVTTTPRPISLIRQLMADPTTHVTRESTFANAANLAPSQVARLREKYEGTRLGRQELHGEVLDDVPGALWNRAMLDALRVKSSPELRRIVVGVDPAVTSGEHADETGIVVVGRAADGQLYVLADYSLRGSPDTWARRAVQAYHDHKADRVVAEVNQGGDLVEATLRTVERGLPIRKVHATRGKRVRAEPIAALYEQGKAHHVGGFAELEDQMCTFLPEGSDSSPDRVDALVWAATELGAGQSSAGLVELVRAEAAAASSASAEPAPTGGSRVEYGWTIQG